jgi:hypothetical protein
MAFTATLVINIGLVDPVLRGWGEFARRWSGGIAGQVLGCVAANMGRRTTARPPGGGLAIGLLMIVGGAHVA